MTYAAFVLNHTIDLNLASSTMTPYTIATFQVTDISPMICFHFWEPVHFLLDNVGIAEHIGHRLTFLIYTKDTNKVIARSAVRSALDPKLLNLCKEPNHIKEHFNTHHQLDQLNLEMNFQGIVQPTENEPKRPRYIAEGIPNVVYFENDDKEKLIFCNEVGEPVYQLTSLTRISNGIRNVMILSMTWNTK